MKYKVTALVSIYNCEKFIKGCLDDLVNQTIFDQTQIMIINSGSQQNEEGIINEYKQKYSNIFYFKTLDRERLYKAWNRGISFASGEYLTSSNSDDRHRKDAFEVMSSVLDNSEVALVYGNQRTTNIANSTFESCKKYDVAKNPDFSNRNMIFKGCFTGSQPMWRKSLHKELGLFDESFTVAGDFEFWCRILTKYPAKHINEELGLYYKNQQGIELSNKRICGMETGQILRKYKEIYSRVK